MRCEDKRNGGNCIENTMHIEKSARESLPLHDCNFAVLQSKIAAVGSKAKFHIKPRSGLMREAYTSATLITLSI